VNIVFLAGPSKIASKRVGRQESQEEPGKLVKYTELLTPKLQRNLGRIFHYNRIAVKHRLPQDPDLGPNIRPSPSHPYTQVDLNDNVSVVLLSPLHD